MELQQSISIADKLKILTDAAKYDVACTSSGTQRTNDGTGIGSCAQRGYVTVFLRMGDAFPC